MRFSLALPTAYEGLGYPVGLMRDGSGFIRLARIAEDLGYHALWANDHLVTPRFLRGSRDGPPNFFEPLTTLAHVAAVTTRLRLGTAVISLALRDPVALVKQVATLDLLCGGRLMLGVGAGAYPDEVATARPERSRIGRAALTDEMVEAIRMLLDRGGGSYRGAAIRFQDIELAPAPRQRPFPVYLGGHGLAAIERAAKWGQGWIPGWRPIGELGERIAILRERLCAVSRQPDAVEVAPELMATVATHHEDAVRRFEGSRLAVHRRSRDRTDRDPALMAASNLVGSPAAILEKVSALANAGVDHCAAIAFPAESIEELIEQWQEFADEVMQRS